jgi:peptide/nickel transport system permease protein
VSAVPLQIDTEAFGELAEPDADAPRQRFSRRALVWRRFRRNRMAVAGLVVLVMLALLALAGPWLIADWTHTELDPGYNLQGPSRRHWFGTTQNGRDLFAMALQGLRKSMLIGLAVGLGSTTIAALVGSFAAYFGGWFDRIAMWVIDLLLVLPAFLIIAIIINVAGGGSSLLLLVVMLAGLGWMLSARVVRSLAMSVKEREYVTAARYMGVPGWRIVLRHILPNISSLLIIDATLAIGAAVIAETGLSFFGFGIRPPDVSLGTLIGDGARMATTYPWTFYSGAGFLVLMVVSINFVGDGLRDALDPSSRSGGRA